MSDEPVEKSPATFYATAGNQVVWQQGDRRMRWGAILDELRDLKLRLDLVIWRRYMGYDTIEATMIYSPFDYKVERFCYVNWRAVEAMSAQEAAEVYQGLHNTFTGRKVTE